MLYAIGVDLGATNIKAVCVTDTGHVLDRQSVETLDDPAGGWKERVRALIELMRSARGEPPAWVGVAAPGVARPDGRGISWMEGRLVEVQGLDWTTYLQSDRLIPVVNDGHAALLAEVWLGAAAGARDAVLLTLGTGVGGAILSGGRLLRGHRGRGGHVGHISLNPHGPPDIVGTPGSLEDSVGNCTLPTRAGGRFTTVDQLVAAYQAGDAQAARIWLESIHTLACGITSLINVVDPECVIIGGGIARAGDALFGPLQAALDRVEWRPTGDSVRLVPAALGEWAGALGAARNAMQASTLDESPPF